MFKATLKSLVLLQMIVWSLVFPLGTGIAQNSPCTESVMEEFFQVLPKMTNWQAIHGGSRKFIPVCSDDGVFAEGYTDAVVSTLAERWQEFPILNQVIKREPSFRRFVLRHINASADSDQLRRVESNAQNRCQSSMRKFCDEIAVEAQKAIREISKLK